MKKVFFSMMILLLTVSFVWARGGADSSADGVVEVSAVFNINPEIVLENNPVIQMMERDLNIRLRIEAPPQSGYGDRVQMLVSTGLMPDLVHYGADIVATQWAQEGLLLDVTDRIANYPNLRRNITNEQFGDCVFLPDGRIYGVPKPNSYDKWGYLINKRWLDRVGLSAPRTIAEFVAVCRAFTFNDPAGTGRRDTYGVSLNASATSTNSGIWHLQNDFFSMAYSISSWHHGMPDVDNGARLRALKQEYPDYMRQLRAMYEEGIIDREFITHTGNESYEKFAQGRVGIVGVSQTNYITGVIERYNLNMDDYVFCAPLVRDSSRSPMYALPPSNWMAYYVNASSSPAKQDAALRVLDWGNSERGFTALQFGIQGVHYNSYDVNARTIDRTPAQLEAFRRVSSNNFASANALNGLPPLQGGATPAQIAKWQIESAAAEAVTTDVFFGFTKMLDNIGVEFPDIVSNLNSLEVRYITGQVSWEQLESYIRNTYAPATAGIAAEFARYMAANPARFVP